MPAPFSDLHSETRLPLNATLPKVAALAEHSPDQAVRVAAAELLHACVLLLVGTNARRPAAVEGEVAPAPLHRLLRPLVGSVLRLAAGGDAVSRQLMGPLAEQLVHWYTL